MIASFFDIVFGCRHRRCSFPITAKPAQRNGVARVTGTYVVCLGCGKEFAYDWKTMQVVHESGEESGPITAPVESYLRKQAS